MNIPRTACFPRIANFALSVLTCALIVACQTTTTDTPPDPGPTPGPDPEPGTENAIAIFRKGDALLDTNPEQAFELLVQSAEAGCDSAQLYVAACYEYSIGTDFDMENAKSFYKEAAKNGNGEAKEKLKFLERSKSKISLPAGCELNLKDILLWNGDTLNIVNGDASFFSSERTIVALAAIGKPLYLSYRTIHADSVLEPFVLDSKETATSLLLHVFPFAFEMEEDEYFIYAKEWIASLEETAALAAAIDGCILQKGYLDGDQVTAEVEAAVARIRSELGLDVLLESLESLPSERMNASRRRASVSSAPGLIPPAISANEYYQEVRSVIEAATFIPARGSWNTTVTVYHSLPIYLGLCQGRAGVGPLPNADHLAYLVKPFNLSAIYKLAGVHGISDLIKTQKAFLSDTFKWIFNPDFHMSDMTWDMNHNSITLELASEETILTVLSTDKSDPILAYSIFDLLVWPVLKSLIKKTAPENMASRIVFDAYLKFLTPSFLNEIRALGNEREWKKLVGKVQDKFTDFLASEGEYLVEKGIFGNDEVYGGIAHLALKFNKNWDEVLLAMEHVDDWFSMWGKIKKGLSWIEVSANGIAWIFYQSTFKSFGVFFDLEELPLPVTGIAEEVTNTTAVIPVSIDYSGSLNEIGVVYSSVVEHPSLDLVDRGCDFQYSYSSNGEFKTSLFNLTPNTTYHVISFVKYVHGEEEYVFYGNVAEFTTTGHGGIADVPGEYL